ncbi:MAG: transposase, partial [Gammaproteobacteria bacterium]
KRGIKTQRLKRSLKRRQAIEPVIGHLKSDGLLGRNYLKGTEGDQMNVMLSCAGHNLRLILRQLRILCLQILGGRTSVAFEMHREVRLRGFLNELCGWITRNLHPCNAQLSSAATA